MTSSPAPDLEPRTEALCRDCFHAEHPLVRCPVIVGSSSSPSPDPVYCECADAGAMEAEIRRLTDAAAESGRLREALEGMPFVRMTGGDMNDHGRAGKLAEACDWDEWMDLVERDAVLRLATPSVPPEPASPEPT